MNSTIRSRSRSRTNYVFAAVLGNGRGLPDPLLKPQPSASDCTYVTSLLQDLSLALDELWRHRHLLGQASPPLLQDLLTRLTANFIEEADFGLAGACAHMLENDLRIWPFNYPFAAPGEYLPEAERVCLRAQAQTHAVVEITHCLRDLAFAPTPSACSRLAEAWLRIDFPAVLATYLHNQGLEYLRAHCFAPADQKRVHKLPSAAAFEDALSHSFDYNQFGQPVLDSVSAEGREEWATRLLSLVSVAA